MTEITLVLTLNEDGERMVDHIVEQVGELHGVAAVEFHPERMIEEGGDDE